MLIINNLTHNHDSTLKNAYSAIQKLTIIDEIQKKIAKQSQTRITSKQIFITLCIDENSDNSLFKTLNIYNVKTFIQRQALKSFTFIQALL